MKTYIELELNKPTLIKVHGWVMLKKVEARKYLALRTIGANGDVVWFKTLNGKKTIIGHYTSSVNTWMNGSPENNNRIEILTVSNNN